MRGTVQDATGARISSAKIVVQLSSSSVQREASSEDRGEFRLDDGEDVTDRFVLAGTLHIPGGIELTTITQAESARPFTITTATNTGRISVNGVPESLDEVRGTPYIQTDLRVSRPFRLGERWDVRPFVEFFNLFSRNNPGANYVTNIALLPVPSGQAQLGNITDICTNAACTATEPITSINQLRMPGGALGDFFGPGTTVGIPFAAQLGVRVAF
ncbi:MAG: carboxypeptidase-like regulatory domain-containing protein [Candidatus Sulfotelmatobacter sp.]